MHSWRPTKPGQAVLSDLDGTLGITTSALHPVTKRIAVMFVGSTKPCYFDAYQLTLTGFTPVK